MADNCPLIDEDECFKVVDTKRFAKRNRKLTLIIIIAVFIPIICCASTAFCVKEKRLKPIHFHLHHHHHPNHDQQTNAQSTTSTAEETPKTDGTVVLEMVEVSQRSHTPEDNDRISSSGSTAASNSSSDTRSIDDDMIYRTRF